MSIPRRHSGAGGSARAACTALAVLLAGQLTGLRVWAHAFEPPLDTRRHTSRHGAGSHTFLFVGGLQRSGTTWLEGLITSPVTSALSFDNIKTQVYEEQRPWEHGNHTQDYFELVAKVGGVEGKFVQDVYQFLYVIRDVGGSGRSLDSLLVDAGRADAASSARLFQQWSIWWDTSKPILLEKTPENFLIGPFLQAAFGPEQTRFVFIMRHPLVWALAIEKWIFADFVRLRTVEERLVFWFECMMRMVDSLPNLRDALVLQLETISSSAEAQAAVVRHLLCNPGSRPAPGLSTQLSVSTEAAGAILSSSLAYVTCWLSGEEFRASMQRCVQRRPFHEPAFAAHPEQLAEENRWRLRQIAGRHELQASQLGYSFRPYVQMARLSPRALQRKRVTDENATSSPASELGVATDWGMVRPALQEALVIPPPRSPPTDTAAFPGPVKHLLVVYHKLGLDSSKPTGMDIRMDQIVHSLLALRVRVHLVCHCDIEISQLSPYGPAVVIYSGSLRDQLHQAMAAANIEVALVFFTTLTMFVHQRMVQDKESWHLEPKEKLPEEHVVELLQQSARSVCIVSVSDDIHHLRVVQVMSRYDAAKAQQASLWTRHRELSFLGTVNTILTVSNEDADALRAKLQGTPSVASSATQPPCGRSCACTIAWVPYTQQALPESSVTPFSQRRNGILYVGGMHGLAIIGVEWLLERVQGQITSVTSKDAGVLQRGGVGHVYLAGPGWSQHLHDTPILNASVSRGCLTILGTLSDLQLSKALQMYRVFAAPVFNGTGVATKNILAMAHGIPLVTTRIGLNGLGLPLQQSAVSVADDPRAFAQAVVEMQAQPGLFETRSRAGLTHAARFLSAAHQQQVLADLLRCGGNRSSIAAESVASTPAREVSCEGDRGSRAVGTASTILERAPRPASNRSEGGIAVIGLPGAGVSFLARVLQPPSACMVLRPFHGAGGASALGQLDHLRALLLNPAYCQVVAQLDKLPTIHGFALELGASDESAAILRTEELHQLVQILVETRSRLLVVRRCSLVAWAAETLVLPAACDTGGSCAQPGLSKQLSPQRLGSELTRLRALDLSLQRLVLALAACPSFHLFSEALHGSSAVFKRTIARMEAFLGSELVVPDGPLVWPADWKSVVSNIAELRAAKLDSEDQWDQATGLGEASSTCFDDKTRRDDACSADECHLDKVLPTLIARTELRAPLAFIGAHGAAGGAVLLRRFMAESCRSVLAPKLRLKCVLRNGFEGCDPDRVDICVHESARFSPGRYSSRGYRFVHILRDPGELLFRSYLLQHPNATHQLSPADLQASLETHWKLLLSTEVRDMLSLSEASATDPNAMQVRIEDLTSALRANSTLRKVISFALRLDHRDQIIEEVQSRVRRDLAAGIAAEAVGAHQRKHLLKVLQHRALKCRHVMKTQQALGYAAFDCPDKADAGLTNRGSKKSKAATRAHEQSNRTAQETFAQPLTKHGSRTSSLHVAHEQTESQQAR